MPTVEQSQDNQEEKAAERDFFSAYEAVTGFSPLVFESFDEALEALEGVK